MQMTCPKCQGAMRQYERSGITIDQCTECRGIFLDRGELEKLIDAEASWDQAQASAQRPAQPAPPPAPAPHTGYAQQPVQHGYPAPTHEYGYHGHYRHKRRKGFLGELFD
jgi:Zn-finger nucleic acid-binding protein